MGYIEDVRSLLKKQDDVTYSDLLDTLLGLEREHAILKLKIQMGLSKDIKTLWKITALYDRIKIKVEKKLNE
jgi:hypothetical protein